MPKKAGFVFSRGIDYLCSRIQVRRFDFSHKRLVGRFGRRSVCVFMLSYCNISVVFSSDWTFEPLVAVIIGVTATLMGPAVPVVTITFKR